MKAFRLLIDDGSHRQSDWLELFFDLAFVICIANLSHSLITDAEPRTLLTYVAYFIPVWWVWNQFTWYSAHFNNGDLIFRTLIFAGAGGSLLLASSFAGHHEVDSGRFVIAYVFLHLLLLVGWARAHRHVLEFRPYIRLKITGQICGIVLWSASLAFDETQRPWVWAAAVFLQLLLPLTAWATVKNMITVHMRHLSERHGLFTIIVLGECLVSLVAQMRSGKPLSIAVEFAVIIALWSVYFSWDSHAVAMKGIAKSFTYNYGHFFLFCALGLVSAGIALNSIPTIAIGCALFAVALFAMEFITRSTSEKINVLSK